MQPAARALAVVTRSSATRTPFVCRGCLSRSLARQQNRSLSSASVPTSPAPSGLATLTSRRLISVSGPDAAKYLQGVITANILTGQPPAPQTVRADQGFYAAFLTAQGRVLHDVFIYRDTANLSSLSSPDPSSTFLIEVDAAEADRLQRHIRRYKLRARFDVRLLDAAEATVAHAWSPPPSPLHTAAEGSSIITLCDTRAPSLGHRLLTRGGAPPLQDLPPVSEQTYYLHRYLHGVAEGQAEMLRESALPLESNLDLAGAIDFRKGCYVGQELTIRTKHRGVVRKRILPCVLYGPAEAPPKGLLYHPEIKGTTGLDATAIPAETSIGRAGKKGRSAGKWLRGVGNVGLALCRLEIMTDVVLPGEGAAGAYHEGDEFVVDAGEGREVKIKAFVPRWVGDGLTRSAVEASH